MNGETFITGTACSWSKLGSSRSASKLSSGFLTTKRVLFPRVVQCAPPSNALASPLLLPALWPESSRAWPNSSDDVTTT